MLNNFLKMGELESLAGKIQTLTIFARVQLGGSVP